MTNQKPQNETRFAFDVTKHLPIIVVFATMFITWGIFSNRIQTVEAQIAVLKVQNDKNTDNVSDVKVSLGEIKTSLEFIKEKLNASSH